MGRPRRWGWHRLDDTWADRLVADAPVRPGDLVLDIGAGDGALTAALLAVDAHVVAVELHPGRAARLRDRFGDAVVVVEVDAADLRLPRRPYHVVANPPFAATTAVLRRILQRGTRLRSATLVLPEHVSRRWSGPAAPGRGRWSTDIEARVGRRVPPSAFRPRAPMPTRVLELRRR